MTQAEVDFTFDEAVRTLGVTPERLERLIDEGKIRAVQAGWRTRIPRQSILEYMTSVSQVGKLGAKKKSSS